MKTTLNVKGMHCASCEMLLRDAIAEVGGMKVASINHKTGKVAVTYDSEASLDKATAAIKAEGYGVIE